MSLKNLNLKPIYSSAMKDDILNSFFIPCLEQSVKYDRVSGFFSPKFLSAAAEGIAPLIKNKGKYRLIFSKHLFSEDDYDSIMAGYTDQFDNEIFETIEDLKNEMQDRPRKILGWMIANNILEIKIAFKKPDNAILHSKWGNFEDVDGNKINFIGSINETEHAVLRQLESVDVFNNWTSEEDEYRVNEKNDRFKLFWNNKAPQIEVVPFSEIHKDKFKIDNNFLDFDAEQIGEQINIYDEERLKEREDIELELESDSSSLSPYDYQQEAIDKWKENGNKGIIALATGLGKTFTAIFAMIDYVKTLENKYLTIVAVPTQDLIYQWQKEFQKFNLSSTVLKDSKNWKANLEEKINFLNLDFIDSEIILVTYNIFSEDSFIKIIQDCDKNSFLIADEAHKAGSKKFSKGLIAEYDAKIALTATPKRHFDEEGTQLLDDYFGGVVSKKDLKWGIKNGYLCPYNYYMNEITLTPKELEQYYEITRKMMTCWNEHGQQTDAFWGYAGDRADIIKEAKNKVDALSDNLKSLHFKLDGAFIFCNTETSSKDEEISQFDQIANLLINNKVRYKPITSKRKMYTRKANLEDFSKGDADVVLAIDCLDEGIDVPSAKMAFILSSTTNEKQYIQRRGRVLRKSKDDPSKVAEIYDFVCFPPSLEDKDKRMTKGIIENQLKRAMDFSKISNNFEYNLNYIKSIAQLWEIELDD